MAEKHLVRAIYRALNSKSREKRIAIIRGLGYASAGDDKFIRRKFPELYQEAFGKEGTGERAFHLLASLPIDSIRRKKDRPQRRKGL